MYNEKEILSILENYDNEFKLDTFAYTKACTFTVKEWFNKFKNKPSREKSLNWWHSLNSDKRIELCNKNINLLKGYRSWESLTGREIEMLYTIEYDLNNKNALLEHINSKSEEAWTKMGDTGNENYRYDEESYWFGYYRALEDIEEKLKIS
jgi:hypothetical protein